MAKITLEVREKDTERLKELKDAEPTTVDQIETEVMQMVTEAYGRLQAQDE